MKTTVIVGIVVAIIVIGGGGIVLATHKSSTNDSMKSMGMNSSTSSSSSAKSKAVATNTVTIQDYSFSPAAITVKKGTKVTWTNQDPVGHTITSDDMSNGFGLDSKLLNKGESYSATFDTVGTYKYHCTPHQYMTATVTVTE